MQHDIFEPRPSNGSALFDTGAHRAIAGWREGGERLGQAGPRALGPRLRRGPQLSEETRRNASHFRDVMAGYYTRGISCPRTAPSARSRPGGRGAGGHGWQNAPLGGDLP